MNTVSAATVERRFRRFLLVLVEVLCVGTVIELWLARHIQQTEQLIPFALCGLAFLSTLAVLLRPTRPTLLLLRGVMLLVIAGSLLGGWLHLQANHELVTELHPNMSSFDALLTSLMGAAPLLAPGILGLAGVLALAATYYHPALGRREPTAESITN